MTLSDSDTPAVVQHFDWQVPPDDLSLRRWLDTCMRRGRTERFAAIVKVGPDLAALLFSLNNGNRPSKRSKSKRYARIMARGDWILTSQGLDVSRAGRLLNGQHRLTAISDAGVTVPMTVWFGCEDAEFKALDKAAARTSADDLSVLEVEGASTAAATAKLIMILQGRTEIDPGAVTAFVITEMNRKALQDAARIGRQKSMASFGQASAVALAYYWVATMSPYGAGVAARNFWNELRDGTERFGAKNSLNRLRNNLLKAPRNNERVNTDKLFQQASTLISAWNAYISKKPVNLTNSGAGRLPEVE